MSSKELRRAGVLARVVNGELKLVNAAVMMGLSYRQSKRLGQRYREEGAEGLKHRSAGRESSRKKPKKFRERVLRLVGKKYSGEEGKRFGPTLAAEHLASDDHVEVNVQTLRRWMLSEGLWSRARKRRVHRKRRERKEHVGELVQLDGSFHDWLEGRGPGGCLMNMVDRRQRRYAGAPGARGDDLGSGGSVACLGEEIRRTGGAVYGLEERVCTRSQQQGTVAGGGAGDAIWADVPAPGDWHHRRQFTAGERSGGEKPRHPPRSPSKENAAEENQNP